MRLIDADALTKQLEEMADNEWNKSVGSSKGLEDAIDVVESMPTIKTFTLADIEEQYRKGLEKGLEARPHGEWIPVSERLPEENETVIASTEYGVFPEAKYTKEDGWEWAYESGADYWEELEGVTAWMPLPEPYKKEGEAK